MIKPDAKKIDEILSNSKQYIIPKYQRQYEWGKEEATEFIADINEHSGVESDSLFLGTIIFDTTDDDKNQISIVDGQQRITTIIILLVACRELAKKLNKINLATLIQQKITFTDNMTGESKGFKLLASESIRDIFQYMCCVDWNGDFPDKIEVTEGKKKSFKGLKRQNNKIRPIYNYLYEQIKQKDEQDLSKFLRSLYNSYIVRMSSPH